MSAYGLIGYPLSHSFSPAYFEKKFAALNRNDSYALFPLQDIQALPALIKAHPELVGLNVTIPYKKAVIPFLDDIDATAQAIGAVNGISISHGKLFGFNTDWIGFSKSISPLLKENKSYKALVLGTGGASKAVQFALSQLQIPYQLVSRNTTAHALSYEALSPSIIKEHTLLINTTPVGMYPNTSACPLPNTDALCEKHIVIDLIYNPSETSLLQKAAAQGAIIKNGYEMLCLQADACWEKWQQA